MATRTTSARQVGRRTFSYQGQITVTSKHGQAVVLSGREAAIVAEIALHAAEIAAVPFGTVHLDLTPHKVGLRVERVEQPIHVEPEGG